MQSNRLSMDSVCHADRHRDCFLLLLCADPVHGGHDHQPLQAAPRRAHLQPVRHGLLILPHLHRPRQAPAQGTLCPQNFAVSFKCYPLAPLESCLVLSLTLLGQCQCLSRAAGSSRMDIRWVYLEVQQCADRGVADRCCAHVCAGDAQQAGADRESREHHPELVRGQRPLHACLQLPLPPRRCRRPALQQVCSSTHRINLSPFFPCA